MNKCFRVSTLLVAALFVCLFGLMSGAQAQNRSVLSKRSLPPDLQNLPPHMLAKMPWLQPDRMKHPNLQQGFNSPTKIYQSWEQRPNSPLSQTKPLSKVTTESGTAQLTSSCLNEGWVARYSESDNSYDYARDIAVDGDGNVYVTGNTFGDDGESDYLTVKYNAAGTLQWTARYNGSGNRSDDALAIAVDGSGNVYVTGGSTNSNFNSDYTTFKYSAAGVQLWEAHYDGPAQSHDGAAALVLDGSGNIYVTGGSYNSGGNLDYATIKYNNAGLQQWEARYNGSGNDYDFATEIALDGSGNVYVAGSSENTGGNADYATIKYDANGVQQWAARYNGPGNDLDLLLALALDGAGNVCVTGRSASALNYDCATLKYDADGILQWEQRYDGGTNANDTGIALAIDGAGSVHVTGYSYSAGSSSYVTLKYSATGVQQWEARYYGTGGAASEAYAIALDGSGNVYVTGASVSDHIVDYATVKYDAAGTQLCEARYDGPGNGEDEPAALVVDGNGNVYVTGYSFGLSDDFATIKYSQESSCLADVEIGTIIVPVNPTLINIAINASADFTAACDNDDHSATWNWGDNTTSAGTVDQTANTVAGSHTYTAAGVYTVTLTVTDGSGNSGEGTATAFVVIYDPNAGFVTGGGWIDSPAGAYIPDPTLTGQANFGFVSKYQKGKSIPDGNTTFHFNAASFKFKSTSYEWLVIAGPNAKYKGVGTVNNGGNYGFMLTARDGQINGGGGVDRFRIKIWDKNNNDAVVYDNQLNDPDNADATDAIEGGSITIHSGSSKKEVVAASESVPESYTLEQNYPNPFNPQTAITFALPEAGRVSLKVYSETGQLVATLVDREMNAGSYTVNWHSQTQTGAPLASGLYFYQLVAQRPNGEVAFTESRRMTLVK